jgi:hypothetical protein
MIQIATLKYRYSSLAPTAQRNGISMWRFVGFDRRARLALMVFRCGGNMLILDNHMGGAIVFQGSRTEYISARQINPIPFQIHVVSSLAWWTMSLL